MRSVLSIPSQMRLALLATSLGALIALSRLLLTDALGGAAPFILAWPAMLLAAFLGGFWPALVVGLIGLGVGHEVMVSAGGTGLRAPGMAIYIAFVLAFAAAGGMRQKGLRRARDDAERLQRMQSRLAQVARLNAMGEIAGTLAHELNQPLTAIASYAGAAQYLAQQKPAKSDEVADLLQKVSDQAVRAREIVGRIRRFVAGGELTLEAQALPDLVEEAVAVATVGEKKAGLQVRYDFDPAADRVLVDRLQLQQVVVNLVRNAAEAMRGARRSEVTIGSRPAGDGMAEIYVADNGPGLAPEVADRLFEPFVTSKDDGMGIGLAVSRGIVEAHGGKLSAEHASTGGAVFRFTLRLADAEAAR